jgi:hypothetical protein
VGGPVRYYLPGAVIVIVATLAAAVSGWTSRIECRGLVIVTLAVLAGGLSTAYLVQTVNLRLFIDGPSLLPVEQSRLLRVWYRVNTMRLAIVALAWIMAARIGIRLRHKCEDDGLRDHRQVG